MVIQVQTYECSKCRKIKKAHELFDNNDCSINLKCSCGGTYKLLPPSNNPFIMQ